MAEDDRPSLLVLRSHIGYPSPKYTDTAAAHGNPLGADEVARIKEILGLPARGLLRARRRARRSTATAGARGARRARGVGAAPRRAGDRRPRRAVGRRASSGRGLDGWEPKLPDVRGRREGRHPRGAATRCSTRSLDVVPGLIAGGADLTGNTGTELDGRRAQSRRRPAAAARSTTASASTAWAR